MVKPSLSEHPVVHHIVAVCDDIPHANNLVCVANRDVALLGDKAAGRLADNLEQALECTFLNGHGFKVLVRPDNGDQSFQFLDAGLNV